MSGCRRVGEARLFPTLGIRLYPSALTGDEGGIRVKEVVAEATTASQQAWVETFG